MYSNTLVILDTKENILLKEKNFDLINLGYSFPKNLNSYKNIDLKKIVIKNFNNFRNKFGKFYFEKISKILKDTNIDYNLIELTNLRNDKTIIFEKIIVLALLKKKLDITKYKSISIYYDNDYFKEIYENLFKEKKIKICFIKNIVNKESKINILVLLKFYLKVLLSTILLKLISKKILFKKKKILNISLYPILTFDYNKHHNNLNFINSDDTHFSNNFFQTFKKVFKLRKMSFLNIEYFLKLKDFFYTFKDFTKNKEKIFTKNLIEMKFENININKIVIEFLKLSILNYYKILLFKNALIRINKILNPKFINYFLFEYNFGFFIKKKLFDANNKLKFYGFQHGIFNQNLMWFDVIKFNKNPYIYLPDYVFYKFDKSKKNYLKYFKKEQTFQIKNIKTVKSNIFLKTKTSSNSNSYLVLLGLHDYFETIKTINNFLKIKNSFKKKFVCKIHPKINLNKINFQLDSKIEVTKYLDENMIFNKIFISKHSTLIYDFLEKKKSFYILKKNILDYNCPNFLKKKLYELK